MNDTTKEWIKHFRKQLLNLEQKIDDTKFLITVEKTNRETAIKKLREELTHT